MKPPRLSRSTAHRLVPRPDKWHLVLALMGLRARREERAKQMNLKLEAK